MPQMIIRKLNWQCGFRKIEVIVEEEHLMTPKGVRGMLRRQQCLDEDPEKCDKRCLFLGGDVNPRNV